MDAASKPWKQNDNEHLHLLWPFPSIAGVELLTPAFIEGRDQFSAQDVETSRSLSSVRIHIERVIGLLKNWFAILQGIIPLRGVKSLKDEAENVREACSHILTK